MGHSAAYFNLQSKERSATCGIIVKNSREHVKKCKRIVSNVPYPLGMSGMCLAPYKPDPDDPANQVAAIVNRVGQRMPNQNGDRMRDFRRYYRALVPILFESITDCDVPSFEGWLKTTSYSEGRKEALRKTRLENKNRGKDWTKCKCFIKDEVYQEPKHARGIMSYSDYYKVEMGPLIKAMETKIFHGSETERFFIKGTNPVTWPERMRNLFGTSPVVATDWSAMEAHHQGEFAEMFNYIVMHIMRGVTDRSKKRAISRLLKGENELVFKSVTAKLSQRLMSGALWTSAQNGCVNLMVSSYLVLRQSNPGKSPEALSTMFKTHYVGIHEGDDGLILSPPIDQELVDSMGVKLKHEPHESYMGAGFCGIYTADGVNCVTDPKKMLRNFMVLPGKTIGYSRSTNEALLKARADSYLMLYPNAPVISALASAVAHRFRGRKLKKSITAENGYILGLVTERATKFEEITADSRVMVERVFGVSTQMQFLLEGQAKENFQKLSIECFSSIQDINYIEYHKQQLNLCGKQTEVYESLLVNPIKAEPLEEATRFTRTHNTERDMVDTAVEIGGLVYC